MAAATKTAMESTQMNQSITPLSKEQLYREAKLEGLSFETTADLAPLPLPDIQPELYQSRAYAAIQVGTEINAGGFNIFAVGSRAARIRQVVKSLLEKAAIHRPSPPDWVYVNNFIEPHRPIAIALPSGRAPAFKKAMQELIDDLKVSLPAIFESEDYQKRRGAIEAAVRKKHEAAFSALQEKAASKNIAILRTPMGFALAPLSNGKVVPPEEFQTWPEEKQQQTRVILEELEKDLEETLRSIPRLEKELRDAVRALDRETVQFAITHMIADIKAKFADIPKVVEHVERVRDDVLANVGLFVRPQGEGLEVTPLAARVGSPFDRYNVNVLVTQADHGDGAPVVEELHPTLSNLVGRIDYLSFQGALVTNFLLIRPGALHRANSGAILMDARALLSEPYSWVALKRALLQGHIAIEDIAKFLGLQTTLSLEPDPVPLDVKVVLYGERLLYYLLAALDPEFGQHFKILADFDDEIDRSPAAEALLARLIASIAVEEKLKPLDRGAVGRTIEYAARIAEDQKKLTLLVENIRDLIREADYWAGQEKREVVSRADVERALAEQIRRASRIRERSVEMILRDVALIETSGARVGQINGLSVITLGTYSFGRPSRITCRVRPGAGKIVDIEREVELGGPLHSKGVLILSGFLAGRYALDTPMSLSASLVFEQSYSGVEGDSASSAELYAILSALAEVPLRQDLAVTGSVNQHGLVQAIGGVNEKIEGFFDICKARGLSGTQGVLIPEYNVQHLMLRADVVEACAEGKFAIYPIKTIDEGIALLTGLPAGERGADGLYPAGSINRLVEDKLKLFAKVRRAARESTELGLEVNKSDKE